VTDPKASAKRVAELYDAALKATEAANAAKGQLEQLARDRAPHDEYLRTTRASLATEIKAKRDTHERECRTVMDEINSKASETHRLNAKAQADAKVAATTRADLESRLERIRAAAS
jgi:hypothetical protein